MNQPSHIEVITHNRRPQPARVDRDAYTLFEVAERIGGVSIRTVYNYIYSGGLRAARIGGKRMILRADLDAFLTSAREGA